jgi:adenylate cyclase
LQQHSYDVVARRYLAASLAHLGRLTEARETVAEILRLQPNSSLTRSRRSSFKYGWMSELYVSGLQMAGLPE